METFRQAHARARTQPLAARATFWGRMAADVAVTSWAERRAVRYALRHVAAAEPPSSRKDVMDRLLQLRRQREVLREPYLKRWLHGYILKCSPRYTLRTSAFSTISFGVPSASTSPSLMM